MGTWMTSCLETVGWEFWNLKKRTELKFDFRGRKLIFQSSPRPRGGVRWKSQHRKKLCLSLLMSKNLKLKEVIKSFRAEPKQRVGSVSSVFGFLCLWTFVNVFPYSYEYVYFTCLYLGRIFLNVNILNLQNCLIIISTLENEVSLITFLMEGFYKIDLCSLIPIRTSY